MQDFHNLHVSEVNQLNWMKQFLLHFHHQCLYLKYQLHSFEHDHEGSYAIHIDQTVPTINQKNINKNYFIRNTNQTKKKQINCLNW